MDSISRTKHCDYIHVGAPHGGGGKSQETKEKEAHDEVTLSTSSHSSKAKKKTRTGSTKTKASKGTEKSHNETSGKSSGVAVFLKDDGCMPDTGISSHRSCGGPDDADDDGACPGGGRKDNMDNPDSVYDDGTCGSGYISGGGNYNGPDGSSSYDEFH